VPDFCFVAKSVGIGRRKNEIKSVIFIDWYVEWRMKQSKRKKIER
jgi:hypothetical protein